LHEIKKILEALFSLEVEFGVVCPDILANLDG
jgi:hypothetical protein